MTAKEVYSGVLKIGDRVRVIQTGRVWTVCDLVTANVRGDRLTVIVEQDLMYDISEVEKV